VGIGSLFTSAVGSTLLQAHKWNGGLEYHARSGFRHVLQLSSIARNALQSKKE
jgi:hypothetical protein